MEPTERLRTGGETINVTRFADDTRIVAENVEELQSLLDAVNSECMHMGLDINIDKNKFMIISKRSTVKTSLTLNEQQIRTVDKYKYLGAHINSELDQEIANAAFKKFKLLLCDRNLNILLHLRNIECYVWFQLLYGVVTWKLKAQLIRKIEAFDKL